MSPAIAIRRLTSLVLFLALGSGLAGGPHPCEAQLAAPALEAAPEPAPAEATAACSAHGPAAPAGPVLQPAAPDGERDCCAEHGADCAYACQAAAAVAQAGAPQVAVQTSARTAVPVSGPFLTLFAHAIDHIPLA